MESFEPVKFVYFCFFLDLVKAEVIFIFYGMIKHSMFYRM